MPDPSRPLRTARLVRMNRVILVAIVAIFIGTWTTLDPFLVSSSTVSHLRALRDQAPRPIVSSNSTSSNVTSAGDKVHQNVKTAEEVKEVDSGKGSRAPSALILTAHPDDEVMFFSPTILGLVKDGWDLSAVCLSKGNADGLGAIRSSELYESYAVLGLSSDRITLIDHELLQDGSEAVPSWDPALIANILVPILRERPVDFLITFDSMGITRHPNHVPLSFSHSLLPTPGLFALPSTPRPRLLVLSSPSLVGKFTGPTLAVTVSLFHAVCGWVGKVWSEVPSVWRESTEDVIEPVWKVLGVFVRLAREVPEVRILLDWVTDVVKANGGGEMVFVSSPREYLTAVKAMLKHRSQLVWFRWLYLAFSRLMWINQLVDGGL